MTTTRTTASTSATRRLLIQVVMVIHIMLLTTCAIWFGFCAQDDTLCIPIFQLLQQAPTSAALLADIPPSLLVDLQGSSHSGDHQQQQRRFDATLTLQIEDDGPLAWRKWSKALQEWIQDSGFDGWPLWKSPPITNVVIGGPLTAKSKFHESTNITTINARTVELTMANTGATHQMKDKLEIMLYVPKTVPFVAVNTNDQQSTAVVIGEKRLLSFVQNLNEAEEAVQASMSYLIPFLEKHGVSENLEKWMESTTLSYLQQAQKELISVRESLISLQSSENSDIIITSDVAARWLQAIESMEEGVKQAKLKQWKASMELLEICFALLGSIKSDPSLIPPLHLQMDHFLAIFAPLLFPLLLPMIAGLIREYKRYKALK